MEKTYHIITYSRNKYTINYDGLKKKLGRFWPRHMESYCYQSMLGHLRLILMAENYYEIDMADAHCQILTGLYPTALRSIDITRVARKFEKNCLTYPTFPNITQRNFLFEYFSEVLSKHGRRTTPFLSKPRSPLLFTISKGRYF